MTRRQRLRSLVAERRGLVVPGAYDAVSARLVEQTGFPAVYMTGFGVSAARLGLPDLGFAGLAEMADQARNLASAVSIPLIADADTGYGNALQVRRTVQQYSWRAWPGSTWRTRPRPSAAATWRARRWCRWRSSSGASGQRSRHGPIRIS